MGVALGELEIDPDDLRRLRADRGARVLDVRGPDEYAAGRIPGSEPVPLPDLGRSLAGLSPGQPVVAVCRVGARSLLAAQLLRQAGVEAYSLAGGALNWVSTGGELDPPDGRVADH